MGRFTTVALLCALFSWNLYAQEQTPEEISEGVKEYKKILTTPQGIEQSLQCWGNDEVQSLSFFTYDGIDVPEGLWTIGTDTGAVYSLAGITISDVVTLKFIVERTMKVTYILPTQSLRGPKEFKARLIDYGHNVGYPGHYTWIPTKKYSIKCKWE